MRHTAHTAHSTQHSNGGKHVSPALSSLPGTVRSHTLKQPINTSKQPINVTWHPSREKSHPKTGAAWPRIVRNSVPSSGFHNFTDMSVEHEATIAPEGAKQHSQMRSL